MGLQVGSDEEMSPRLRVTPSFLAKEALNSQTLEGKTVEDLLAEAAAAQTQSVYGVADEAGLTVTDSNDFGLMTCDAGFILKAGDAGVWDCRNAGTRVPVYGMPESGVLTGPTWRHFSFSVG